MRVPGEERLRDGEPDQALLASLRRVRMRRSRSVSDLQLIADVSFALLQPTRISDSGSSGAVGGAGAVALPLWRRRVLRAKWKAWWHLKFFMALTAAIKRRRRYAQAMPDNSSTYYVARLLGEDCEKFGECQEIHSEIALLGAAALRTIQVLYLGRHWRAKAKKMAAARRGREATMAAAAKGVRFADQGGGAGDASGAAAGPNAPLVATRAAGSYMEIHRHRRLVAAMMDKRRPTFLTMKHREDLDNITRVAAANMAMFVNRANGQWVEEKPWTAPLLLGASMLGRKEQQGYEQLAAALLGDGKIAVQIICADDEQVVVNTNSYGEEVLSELMSTDLWGPMSKMFPWKIPTGDRIEGLSVLARRVLQVLTDVELAGGPAAARSMKLVLCVASDMEGWLNRELTKHQFFTLPPSNVIVVVQPKFPGVMWDKATGQFVMAADADGPPRHTFGSGYAMLQLAWPGCAHTISPADGSKVPLEGNGSVLATLAAEGVEFLQTGFLSDWEALHNNSRVSGAANMDFLVPALYALDERGANMAMEVIEAPEGLSDKADALARHQQSWVLGPAWKRFSDGGSTLAAPPAGPRSFGGAGISSGGAAGSPSGSSSCSSGGGLWSCNVSLNDLQTPKARWLLSQAARRGPLASCCSRYLFSVQALSKILLGPNVFKHNIRIEGSFAFLDLDLADVTSMPGAKAVSVCCQARGPRLGARIHDRQLLQELVVPVAEQDMQGLFKLKACQSSSACAPVAIKSKSLANQRPWRIMLFVDASAASKAAFRMAKRFLTHGEDLITVVHVAVTEAAVLAGPGVLAEYDDPTVRDQVQHKLLNKIDARLSEAIRKEVEAAKPDLVVFGSDKLSKTALPTASGSSGGAGAADGKSGGSSSGGSGSKSIRMAGSSATPDAALGSLSLSLLMSKTILDVPLLVVKPTSSGEMLRAAANPGERPAMRAMMEVHTTSGPLLSWLMDKCDKARDRLVLARTRALDREGRPQQTSQRILMSMADLAHKRGFQTVLRPLGEGPTESIPEAVRRDKVDLLVVQAVQDVATPVAILDLLRACPTSVLIHRARPQDLTDAAAAEVAAAT